MESTNDDSDVGFLSIPDIIDSQNESKDSMHNDTENMISMENTAIHINIGDIPEELIDKIHAFSKSKLESKRKHIQKKLEMDQRNYIFLGNEINKIESNKKIMQKKKMENMHKKLEMNKRNYIFLGNEINRLKVELDDLDHLIVAKNFLTERKRVFEQTKVRVEKSNKRQKVFNPLSNETFINDKKKPNIKNDMSLAQWINYTSNDYMDEFMGS